MSAAPNGHDALKEQLVARALSLGFHRVGVARAEPLLEEGAQLRAWLADGFHGAMGYMAETAEVRADVTHAGMLPGAHSVVVLATAYARSEQATNTVGRIARYARGRDYHNVLGKRVQKLAKMLRALGFQARAGVDSLPIFERAWAVRAGVGFVGKNCCLIVPGLGSHVFLSALVTSAELSPDAPMPPRCGSCRACLDACPTQAFEAPRRLDARRCIAYLTIEQRGAIPEPLRTGVGDHLFGCDVCQDVCPFNATKPLPPDQTQAFARDPGRDALGEADWLELDEAAFRERTRGSPLSRPGASGLARNAAVVLGNRGGRVHLPVLQRVATQSQSPVVREAAAWAVEQIRRRES